MCGSWGLLWWLSSKESICQFRKCSRCGFDSWVRKIPWKRKWRSSLVFLPSKLWTEEPGGLHSMGSQSWIWLSNWACMRFLDIGYICYSLFLWGEGSLLCGEWWWQSVSVYPEGKKQSPMAPCQSSFSPQLGMSLRMPITLDGNFRQDGPWGYHSYMAISKTKEMARIPIHPIQVASCKSPEQDSK